MPPYRDITVDEAQRHLDAYVATLPARLEWLAEAVPDEVDLDGTRASLVSLWQWVLTQEPDLDASRDGVQGLPLWLDYDEGFRRRWGPHLLRLTDALVAYVAHIYEREFPGTRWKVHTAPKRDNSAYQNQPVLDVGNGRTEVNLPLVLSVNLKRALIDRDPGDRKDERLLELYCLRPYRDITQEEAQQHLDAYVATLPARLEWLANAVTDEVVLDDTRASLVPLWQWVLTQEPDLDARRDVAPDLPLWLDYDEGFRRRWGPRLLLLNDALVAYVAHVYEAEFPGTRWKVHTAPKRANSAYQNQPVLDVGNGRTEVNLPHVLSVILTRALIDRDPGDRKDETLLDLYYRWQGLKPPQ